MSCPVLDGGTRGRGEPFCLSRLTTSCHKSEIKGRIWHRGKHTSGKEADNWMEQELFPGNAAGAVLPHTRAGWVRSAQSPSHGEGTALRVSGKTDHVVNGLNVEAL